jgi:hypothetical protein
MCQCATYNSVSCEFVNQTMRFAMIHVTQGWLYKLTQDAARCTPAPTASWPAPCSFAVQIFCCFQAGKKMSLKNF